MKKVIFESKFNKLYSELMSVITESRKENLAYTEKKVKDAIDKISVKVTGSSADKINRLAKAIDEMREAKDELTKKEKELTTEAKSYATEFFDEADKVYTRVIEANKAIITFGKVSIAKRKDAAKLEALVGEIADLLKDQETDLAKQIKQLIENCNYISEGAPTERLTTKVVEEGVKDFVKTIKAKVKSWIAKLGKFFEKFDKRQEEINAKLDELKSLA